MKTSRRSVLGLVAGFVGLGWLVKLSGGKTIGVDPAEGDDQMVIYDETVNYRLYRYGGSKVGTICLKANPRSD